MRNPSVMGKAISRRHFFLHSFRRYHGVTKPADFRRVVLRANLSLFNPAKGLERLLQRVRSLKVHKASEQHCGTKSARYA